MIEGVHPSVRYSKMDLKAVLQRTIKHGASPGTLLPLGDHKGPCVNGLFSKSNLKYVPSAPQPFSVEEQRTMNYYLVMTT